MKSLILFFLSVYLFLSPISAQKDLNYRNSMNEINEYLLSGEYADALPLLLKLEKSGFTGGNVEYKIGTCYLNMPGSEAIAIPYLQKATSDISPNRQIDSVDLQSPIQAYLYLGDAYRVNNQLIEAKHAYQQYFDRLDSEDTSSISMIEKRLNECHFAKIMMNHKIQVNYNNLGPSINSGLANLNGCISGDGKTLVFTRKMKFYDAIFICKRNGNDWTKPEEITTKLGSDGEFYPTSLSFDGTSMLLNTYNFLTGYDIYESNYINGKWTKVKKLTFQVSTQFNDVDAVYAPDGKSIYFSSNRESGLGGYDIYKSTRDELGNWSFVENIGPPVNTPLDERSPTIFDNGKVLVFSSNAEPSMGGFDYFYALKDSVTGKYSTVYNAGYPLNSTGNESGIKMVNKPGEGVIAKHDATGYTNCDLYMVQFGDFSKFHLIPVHGTVTENGGLIRSPQDYVLSAVDEIIKDTFLIVKLDNQGVFKMNLYPGHFLIQVKSKTIEQHKEIIIPPDESNQTFATVIDLSIKEPTYIAEVTAPNPEVATIKKESAKPIPVPEEHVKTKACEEGSVVLTDTCFYTDILFGFNQYKLSVNEVNKLTALISKLKACPVLKIRMVGYTDAIGSKEYNNRLSMLRALEVKKFFQEHGFSDEILIPDGAGSRNFIAINTNTDGTDNPRGRSFNRRVEIKIDTHCNTLLFIRKNPVPKQLLIVN